MSKFFVKSENVEYVNPNGTGDGDENNVQYTKEELSQNLGFSYKSLSK